MKLHKAVVDTDQVMGKFMLFTIIGSILVFIWYGVGNAPLIVVWLLGGMLVLVSACWIMEDFQKCER